MISELTTAPFTGTDLARYSMAVLSVLPTSVLVRARSIVERQAMSKVPYAAIIKRVAARAARATSSPLSVAVVGAGRFAATHVSSYQQTGLARVVAVCDISPVALARAATLWPTAATYRDYRHMLQRVKPDVVSVCTWPQSHADVVVAAADAGVKAILCEKPLALTMHEIDRMAASCQQRGVKLASGHQYRFHPNFVAAADAIRDGAIGDVRAVKGWVAGTLADNGPHLMDAVRFLLGDLSPVRVNCSCHRQGGRTYQGYPAEDGARGEVVFQNSLLFQFMTGDQAPSFFGITVEGERGCVEVTPTSLKFAGTTVSAPSSSGPECRQRQFGAFLQWVRGRAPEYASGFEEGARAAEMVLAAYESARTGKPVDLPLPTRGDVIRLAFAANGATAQASQPPLWRSYVPAPAGTEALAMDGGQKAVRGWFSTAPCVGAREMLNLARVIRSKQMNRTDGQQVPNLEWEWARDYGSPCAVASTSGTAALHIALGAINPNPGDEVVTTPITDMGSIIPILACNCIPVFADVDPDTGSITAETIAKKLTPRTRAVILVHLFGRPARLDPILDLLRDRGIPLIEDCAQAHFAEYKGRKVGTFGDFGCFSLQQSKQITCGDGGITLVNNQEYAERAMLFMDKGWYRKQGLRTHLFMGMNYRMTELQAAVARAQLKKLPQLVAARRRAADHLTALLSDIDGVVPPVSSPDATSSWWIYTFSIDEERLGVSTDEFCAALQVEGAKLMRQYLPRPVFDYDVLRDQRTYGDSRFPFSAVDYTPPAVSDYPGFLQFQRRHMLIFWSNRVTVEHAAAIGAAVRKVAAYYRATWGASKPERLTSATPTLQGAK